MFLDRFSHIFIAFQRLGTIVHYLRGFVRRPGIIFHVFSNVFDVRGQYFVYFQRFSMSWVSFSFFSIFFNVWGEFFTYFQGFATSGFSFSRICECLGKFVDVPGQFDFSTSRDNFSTSGMPTASFPGSGTIFPSARIIFPGPRIIFPGSRTMCHVPGPFWTPRQPENEPMEARRPQN